MAPDIRAEPIAAEQHFTTEERIPFPFEIEVIGQRHLLVTVFEKPFFEKLLFTLPLGEAKFAANESLSAHEARISGKHHVRQIRLRRDQLDLAAERLQGLA